MNMCTRYKLICRIRHHMRKKRQYKLLQEYENMVYGVYSHEDEIYDELYNKEQWHFRYALRLKALLNRNND